MVAQAYRRSTAIVKLACWHGETVGAQCLNMAEARWFRGGKTPVKCAQPTGLAGWRSAAWNVTTQTCAKLTRRWKKHKHCSQHSATLETTSTDSNDDRSRRSDSKAHITGPHRRAKSQPSLSCLPEAKRQADWLYSSHNVCIHRV